ncbi:hypothetical protein IQ06DRAFT_351191 [Phaeosphaeriaceae sp. SRC1lsM3a]|nr:hypothetical protein IQ06DRAFT_351191 [Stagonospora sp. SRC1lsM3a]
MPKEEGSRKVFVRKHLPSYWSVWFGKNKKPKEAKDHYEHHDNASMQAHQGSVQGFSPQHESYRGVGNAFSSSRDFSSRRPDPAGSDHGFGPPVNDPPSEESNIAPRKN